MPLLCSGHYCTGAPGFIIISVDPLVLVPNNLLIIYTIQVELEVASYSETFYLFQSQMHLVYQEHIEFREKSLELDFITWVDLIKILFTDYLHNRSLQN